MICDNDNVSFDNSKPGGVLGTPGFMAPEIVRGEKRPSKDTDRYSLSVLLFYLFMVNHPLEGKLEASIRCMDMAARVKLYGTEPVFIFDPNNKTNRPVKGIHDNATIYWPLYPEKLRQMFTKAFTVGLNEPSKRITEPFYLFMVNHPLEGKLEASIRCMDMAARVKLYGTEPVFIFDPNNKTNRPVKGIHDNATIYWPLYPEKLRQMFTKAFTVGLNEPSKRITEPEWMTLFSNMMSGMLQCSCGAQFFYDEDLEAKGVAHTCTYLLELWKRCTGTQ